MQYPKKFIGQYGVCDFFTFYKFKIFVFFRKNTCQIVVECYLDHLFSCVVDYRCSITVIISRKLLIYVPSWEVSPTHNKSLKVRMLLAVGMVLKFRDVCVVFRFRGDGGRAFIDFSFHIDLLILLFNHI